jgi:alkylation response protein AidB-like acyl-CoA dehydrogenase
MQTRNQSLDFAESPDLQALRHEARQVAADAVDRFGTHNDSWIVGFSKEFSAELGARGWIGMTWPVEFGGGGRPPLERLVVAEELIAAGAPIAASWFADRQMGPTLIAYGSDDQRKRFLPGILSGGDTWCIGMSEPGAGSDLAGVSTRAVRDGDEYVLNGQKIWTSGAALSDYCYLICRTSTEGPLHAGISEIVVPLDTRGIEIRPIADATGNRHFCEVFYSDVRVPADNLVGVEGGAFKQSMRQLEHERGGIDRLASNARLYRVAKERADASDPLIRQEIASLEIGYRIGRILVSREVLGQAPRGFSAATKTFCTEHEQRVASFVARVLGPEAMMQSYLSQGIVYAPAYTIMGGTAHVLRNILGERVLGLPKEPRLDPAGRTRR